MTFEIVLEIAALAIALVYGYVWKGSHGKTMDPKKLARYRVAALGALGWALLIFVKIVTHTYK